MKKNILWIIFVGAFQFLLVYLSVVFIEDDTTAFIILRITNYIVIPLLIMLILKIAKSKDNTIARAFAISVCAHLLPQLVWFLTGSEDMFQNHTIALMLIAYALVYQKYIYKKQ